MPTEEVRGKQSHAKTFLTNLAAFTGNFTTELQLANNKFNQRGNKDRATISQVMIDADRQVWRCDPDVYKNEETFEQINVFSGFVTNEVALNSDGSCTQKCSDFQRAYNNYHETLINPPTKNCLWTNNCQFIDSELSVCLSVKVKDDRTQEGRLFIYFVLQDPSSRRRYEYMISGAGKRYGPDGNCNQSLAKAESWTRWFVHCSVCVCKCIEPDDDKLFSLREVVSNIDEH